MRAAAARGHGVIILLRGSLGSLHAHCEKLESGEARRAFMSDTTAYVRALQRWSDGWRRAAREAPLSFRVIGGSGYCIYGQVLQDWNRRRRAS